MASAWIYSGYSARTAEALIRVAIARTTNDMEIEVTVTMQFTAVLAGTFGDMEMRVERVTENTFRTSLHEQATGRQIFQGELFGLSVGQSMALPMAIKFCDA
jgi:hypothetical protein